MSTSALSILVAGMTPPPECPTTLGCPNTGPPLTPQHWMPPSRTSVTVPGVSSPCYVLAAPLMIVPQRRAWRPGTSFLGTCGTTCSISHWGPWSTSRCGAHGTTCLKGKAARSPGQHGFFGRAARASVAGGGWGGQDFTVICITEKKQNTFSPPSLFDPSVCAQERRRAAEPEAGTRAPSCLGAGHGWLLSAPALSLQECWSCPACPGAWNLLEQVILTRTVKSFFLSPPPFFSTVSSLLTMNTAGLQAKKVSETPCRKICFKIFRLKKQARWMGHHGRRVPVPRSKSEQPGGHDAGAPTRSLLCQGAPAHIPTLLWLRAAGSRVALQGSPRQ